MAKAGALLLGTALGALGTWVATRPKSPPFKVSVWAKGLQRLGVEDHWADCKTLYAGDDNWFLLFEDLPDGDKDYNDLIIQIIRVGANRYFVQPLGSEAGAIFDIYIDEKLAWANLRGSNIEPEHKFMWRRASVEIVPEEPPIVKVHR